MKVPTKLSVLPELEVQVKSLYNGTCGAGIISDHSVKACHSLNSYSGGFHALMMRQSRDYGTNSVQNYILTDSTAHGIYNARQLAVEHVS